MIPINSSFKKIINSPYPFDKVDENKKKAAAKFGKDYIIDFGIGDPTDPTPEVVRKECVAAVEDTKAEGYPDSSGGSEFKEAVVQWMKKRFSVSLSHKEIVNTYGAKFASFHIPWLFINPNSGEKVLIPNPSYPPYTEGTILAGGEPYFLNITEDNDFEPDVSSLPSDLVKESRVLFVNSPHSPTGKAYSKDKFSELIDFCNDNSIILVSDECYSDLYFGEKPHSVLEFKGSEDCAIVLNSLSKRSMMTGYAVGFYASKNPELLKPFDVFARKSTQGVANIIQRAAAAAFSDEDSVKNMGLVYKERLEALLPMLDSLGCKVRKPDGTFFVWAKVPRELGTEEEFAEKLLLEKGINCVPGNLISREFNGVNPGKGFVRFALVTSVEKIREASSRLENL